MAKEIERKFLVTDKTFAKMANRTKRIRQAYLSDRPEATVRIRVIDRSAFMTVKGITSGCVRDEWEYPIPVDDAVDMANRLAGGFSIDKTRHYVPYEGFTWEIDEFHGSHEGLIIAEVEMPTADSAPILPPFIGKEVTGDPAYYNSTLSHSTTSPAHTNPIPTPKSTPSH